MNILHIGKFYPPYHGGMETYLSDLAKAQLKQGHQVTIWVHNHEYQGLASKTSVSHDNGLTIIRQKSLKPLLFTPIMLGFGAQLKALMAENEFDLINLHWPNPSLFGLLFGFKKVALPRVISWHSDMVTERSSVLMKAIYWFIKPLETKLLKQAKGVLVSTQNYVNHSPQLQRFSDQVKVIPLGLSAEKLNRWQQTNDPNAVAWAASQWQCQGLKLFHLGRLTAYKNQKMLIAVMKQLPNDQLLMAGGGDLMPDLQKLIEQHEVQAQVSLLGAQSSAHIHVLMATCDVFCMASNDRAESFGVVLLEAMFYNKIILVPDTAGSGMSWLAQNYNKGYVFKTDDLADFERKLEHIRENKAAIMTRPRDFKYPMNTIAESIQQYYTTLIERRK